MCLLFRCLALSRSGPPPHSPPWSVDCGSMALRSREQNNGASQSSREDGQECSFLATLSGWADARNMVVWNRAYRFVSIIVLTEFRRVRLGISRRRGARACVWRLWTTLVTLPTSRESRACSSRRPTRWPRSSTGRAVTRASSRFHRALQGSLR